jgi:ribose 5-phosphate isomerase A
MDPRALDRLADAALTRVADGMTLGLGSGRTSEAFIRRLGERGRRGLAVSCVATSRRSEELARRENLRVVTLEEIARIDLAVDGADEVTPALALIKGLGGALLRERVIAHAAESFVVLVTPEKLVPALGTRAPVPVEIIPFAAPLLLRQLAALGATPALRQNDAGLGPYVTDNQNWIVHLGVAPLADPAAFDARVRALPGVVDTGIFVDLADTVLVGDSDGVRALGRGRS